MHVNRFKTFLSLIVISIAFAHAAHAGVEYIWDDQRGFLSASGCRVGPTTLWATPYRVLQANGTSSEGQRLQSTVGLYASLAPFNSLVRIERKDDASRANNSFIQILNSPGLSQNSTPLPAAQKGDFGWVPDNSLDTIDKYVLQFYAQSIYSKTASYSRYAGNGNQIQGTFWKIARELDSKGQKTNLVTTYYCGNDSKKYYVFDVFKDLKQPQILRVGVNTKNTIILESGYVIKETDLAAAQAQAQANQGSSNPLESLINMMGSPFGLNTDGLGKPTDSQNGDDQPEGDDGGDEVDTVAPTPVDRPPDIVDQNKKPAIVTGPNQHIVCVDTYANAHDNDDFKKTFQTKRFERINIHDSFDKPNSKPETVNGTKYTFLWVDFPDRTDPKEQTGWVVDTSVKLEGDCDAYQEAMQNVVCISEGTQNGYDKDFNVKYSLQPLEEVMLEPDSIQRTTPHKASDGKTYDYIPLLIPSEDMNEAFVAKHAIMPKNQCDAAQVEKSSSITGLDAPGCCNFPLKSAPNAPYRKGLPGAGQKWYGGSRVRRNHGYSAKDANRLGWPKIRVHAACDLLQGRGSSVYSVAPGTVILPTSEFYRARDKSMTYELEVRHVGGKIGRYGEMKKNSPAGIKSGANVSEGTLVGNVGNTDMLHFELYSGTLSGPLTVRPARDSKGRIVENQNLFHRNQERRADLIDPTALLESYERRKFGRSKND